MECLGEAMAKAPRSIVALARAGLLAFYGFMKEDHRRAQVLLIDAFSASQQTQAKSQAAMGQYVGLINKIAQELYPQAPEEFNIEMLSWGLLGMALQVGVNWASGGYKQPVEEVMSYNLYAWQGLEAWIGRMIADAREQKNLNRRATDPRPGEFGIPPGVGTPD
jgi:hypothetical protein